MDIIKKIKEAGLKGRGGGSFSTALKWELAKKAQGKEKYVICNAAEGEPNVFKDKYILDNYLEDVINGIKIAKNFISAKSAYIYLNKNYTISEDIGDIIIFKKDSGYIGGEETSICEAIEGKRVEPRRKPPFLTESGLFGCPTLLNNVETFYCVSKIAKGEYNHSRFFSINGDVLNQGVYELREDITIFQALKETKNYPEFDFFAQVGGGASGEIMLPQELNRPVFGAGSITIYNREKTDKYELMEKWAEFFHTGNCDKCVPCREGAFRIYEMIKERNIDYDKLDSIFFSLKKSSFCSLGKSIPLPFESLIKKIR
ncbi:MAG: NADH-ubiquinone oxidoreductase-F iron-sulfur binding region domain-containing protein [Candidatus Pacebacteria bacterium]|nr:NADH-ubiquinone oxidoreductase-F iron-sulfur binding region domain-containing protein [Candidatus Paceibacterota bacterium]MDD4073926.1 NADH-ubiquinone oxidoreductase-F iron-sulfur binding region domain-containing protein [Candidatus Paceibacterota bacterium]